MAVHENDPEPYALAGAVLASSGAALIPLAAALVRHLVPERVGFFARWGFSHVLAALCGGMLVLAFSRHVPGEGVLRELHASLLAVGGAAGVGAFFAHRLQPEGLRALGFHRGLGARSVAAGAGAYLCLLPVLAGLERVWPLVRRWLGLEGEPSPLLGDVVALEGPALAWALVLCVVIGPLLEETLFRGYLQPLCVQNFSQKGGIAVVSFLFAALHGASAFLPLFAFSLLLGALQARTQRLVACWAVHGLHNAAVLFVALRFPEAMEIVR